MDFQLFSYINRIRTQHNASSEDYKDYRKYCSKRLRRIRKSNNGFFLQLNEGNVYSKRDSLDTAQSLRENNANDNLILLLIEYLIVQAERAWAYSFEIKQELDTSNETNGVKNRHMRNRMKKAICWSDQLCNFCNEFMNKITQTKAKAYNIYFKAKVAFDKEDLESAAENFEELNKVYEQLQSIVTANILQPLMEESTYYLKYCGRYLNTNTKIGDQLNETTRKATELQNDSQMVSVFGVEINVPVQQLRSDIERVWENFVLFQSMFQENTVTEDTYMDAFSGLDDIMKSLRKAKVHASNSAELIDLEEIVQKAKFQIIGQNSLLRLREVILNKKMEKLSNIYRLAEKAERTLYEAEEFTVKDELLEIKLYKSFLLAIVYLKEGKHENIVRCLSLLKLSSSLLSKVKVVSSSKMEIKERITTAQAEALLLLKPKVTDSVIDSSESRDTRTTTANSKKAAWFKGWFS